jgi:hypothetical protein
MVELFWGIVAQDIGRDVSGGIPVDRGLKPEGALHVYNNHTRLAQISYTIDITTNLNNTPAKRG